MTGLGGYLVFLPFEPHMHAHLFALKDVPPHYVGVVRLVYAMAHGARLAAGPERPAV